MGVMGATVKMEKTESGDMVGTVLTEKTENKDQLENLVKTVLMEGMG